MSRLINAERKVHVLAYDDEHEENIVKYMTVEELLDEFTDEGCPTIISDSVQHGRWIPCSERLPEDDTPVLVYLFEHNKSPYIAWLSDERWYTEDFEVERENEPVAWMPLPEPYKMDEVEE